MKKTLALLSLMFISLTAFASPKPTSLLEAQIQLVNQGIATGQITNETKDFFIQSLRDMQNGNNNHDESAVSKFTRLVQEGIASGQITDATKGFFLQAIIDLNQGK